MAHPFKAAQPPSWLRGLGSAANLRPAGIPRCAQRNAVGIVAASFELSFCAQVAGRRGPARHPGQCALRTLAGRTRFEALLAAGPSVLDNSWLVGSPLQAPDVLASCEADQDFSLEVRTTREGSADQEGAIQCEQVGPSLLAAF